MARVPKNLPIDLQDAQSMRSWLGRLTDMPGDLFEDDDLESLRWDVAHMLLASGAVWYAAHVIAGDLAPRQHGKHKLSDEVFAEVAALVERSPQATKDELRAALGARFDCMAEGIACEG